MVRKRTPPDARAGDAPATRGGKTTRDPEPTRAVEMPFENQPWPEAQGPQDDDGQGPLSPKQAGVETENGQGPYERHGLATEPPYRARGAMKPETARDAAHDASPLGPGEKTKTKARDD